MDVLLRLRVLIWIVLLSLWGVMVYQYLGEEEAEDRMHKVVSPYTNPLPTQSVFPEQPPSASPQEPLDHAEVVPPGASEGTAKRIRFSYTECIGADSLSIAG